MDQPWGISGPEFLLLYGGLLVIPAVVVAVLLAAGRRAAERRAREQERLPSIYHLAYLVGGAERVVDTAIASLLERGSLRVSSSGAFQVTRETASSGLMEHAVLANAALYRYIGRGKLIAMTLRSPFLADIQADLEHHGLIAPQRRRGRLLWSLCAGYVLLGILGVVRLTDGIQRGYPVGLLIMLLIVTAFLAAGSGLLARPRFEPTPTEAGEHVATTERRHLSTSGTGAVGGAAAAVLVAGLVNYPDSLISRALTQSPSGGGGGGHTAGAVCSSGDGGGTGCASGCGGGGGGGGGCGGGGG
ncbi:TIGR04222 domain-containing membrane protein [Amycolatopsis cihanbeyliensis]|uniref:Uncharacterized protein (TIGR04222 family) n=1 Tax=Amycolatopsis cihanbeyliensis TaxID=1128664 RepID=A0A542DDA7_AMYCI|nr:TIGR04222 domain-containing membrane protein [Amycolatopsis cihanbeyliensis]TQJ01042.1 uncharacterized protein (TIGR04222 family) [Amycolatopsis cihanbeyliensis]